MGALKKGFLKIILILPKRAEKIQCQVCAGYLIGFFVACLPFTRNMIILTTQKFSQNPSRISGLSIDLYKKEKLQKDSSIPKEHSNKKAQMVAKTTETLWPPPLTPPPPLHFPPPPPSLEGRSTAQLKRRLWFAKGLSPGKALPAPLSIPPHTSTTNRPVPILQWVSTNCHLFVWKSEWRLCCFSTNASRGPLASRHSCCCCAVCILCIKKDSFLWGWQSSDFLALNHFKIKRRRRGKTQQIPGSLAAFLH